LRKTLRKVVRIVLRIFVALVVVIVLAISFLHTPWGKSWVRGRIEAKLAAAVDGKVSLGGVDYGFMFSHIELRQLEIHDRLDVPIISIGAIHVALDRRSLLHGSPVLDELVVHDVVASIEARPGGKNSLDGLFVPSGQPPPPIRIAKLHVDGVVTMRRLDGTQIHAGDLVIDGSVTARPGEQVVEAAIASITGKVAVIVPGAIAKQLDLAVGPITASRHGGAIEATVANFALGAVSIGELHAKLGLDHGRLVGDQAIAITRGTIERHKLSTMLGKQVLVDDVTFDASFAGPPDQLVAHGKVATRQTALTLDGTAAILDPARPTYAFVLVGKGASEDLIAAASSGLPPILTDVRVAIEGHGIVPPDLDATIALDIGATHMGAIAIAGASARAHAHAGGITLDSFTGHGLGFELTASGDIASDTTLRGTVTVAGSPTDSIRVLRAAGFAVWHRVPPIGRLAVTVTASGKLDGELALEVGPSQMAIAGGTVKITGHAVLDHEKVRDASTTISLAHLDLGGLARLAHKPAPTVDGSLSGTLTLTQIDHDQRASYELSIAVRDPAVTAKIHGVADLVAADVEVRVLRSSDAVQLATITAHVAHDDTGLLPRRAWHVVLDAPARSLAELGQLAPPELLANLGPMPSGDLALHADLVGTPNQPRGAIDATVHAETPAGPQVITIHAAVASAANRVAVTTHAQIGDLATIDSHASTTSLFAGRSFALEAVKRGLSADATIDIPERELATVPLISPALARLGGSVGGRIEVTGAPAAPKLSAKLAWHGYALAGGGPGETTLQLAGTPDHLTAELAHGPIHITADAVKSGERIAVVAKMHSDPTPLVPLLPAAIVPDLAGNDPGTLDWDMTAKAMLVMRGRRIALEDANVDGTLAVRGGAFALHGGRRWHDLELELAGDPRGLRLTKLAAHESDEQVKDRSLEVSGLVTITRDAQNVEFAIGLHDWLVLGSGSPLFSDAPIGTVNLAANVTANLTTPISIDATIEKLDVAIPDRLDRSHQPEKPSVIGDVIFESAHPGALPVVPKPAETADHRVPLDVRIHIPRPIHALKSPLDLQARGELTVSVRDEGIATRGTLDVAGGELVLFGREQPVVDGSLSFTDEHPHGEFALHFARPLPPEVARELSHHDEPARVTLTGAPTKPVVALGGATNISLDEVLSMYHAGHPVYITAPGLYPSSAAELPHGEQFLIFGFLANALPHFLFLDRVAAWSDPSEPRGAYGRIRNLEADRYAADRSARVRVIGRPTEPGRSTAEVQLDHLWVDTGRALFGAGLRAGDRIGGGVALFFQWSSEH
jgi:hypothetical protein